MKTNLPSRSFTIVALAGLLLNVSSCSIRSCSSKWDALGISLKDEVSDTFLERASARGWYLVAGSCFYRLDEYVDCLLLPEPGEKEPIDIGKASFFGSFDLNADGTRIVAESFNRETPYRTGCLVVYDENLATVYEDESLIYYNIYAPYRWSPDGKYISYAHGTEVRLLDIEKKTDRAVATNHAPVVRDGQPYGTPSWDAESKRLTYQTSETAIAILDVESGKAQRIGQGFMPSWSPDGSKIAFLQGRPGQRDAVVYHTHDGRLEKLFKTWSNQPFIWSPDSQFLVFSKGLLNTIYGEMVVYSFETGKVTSTGRQVASIRDGLIEVLPEWFVNHLRELADKEQENPNRQQAR